MACTPPLRSSWVTSQPCLVSNNLEASRTSNELTIGLSYYLIDRLLERHAERIHALDRADKPVLLGSNTLIPSLNSNVHSIDFPKNKHGNKNQRLLQSARESILTRFHNRKRAYAFIDTSNWTISPVISHLPHEQINDGGYFLTRLSKLSRAPLCVKLKRVPADAELEFLLQRGSTFERFEKAMNFVSAQSSAVRQDELGKHLGLSKSTDRFGDIWEMLKTSGANIQGHGRPKKK